MLTTTTCNYRYQDHLETSEPHPSRTFAYFHAVFSPVKKKEKINTLVCGSYDIFSMPILFNNFTIFDEKGNFGPKTKLPKVLVEMKRL